MTVSHRQPAFTLIEMITVIAILAIISAMAIPRFSNAAVQQRVDAAARRVVADLNLARRHARQMSASQMVAFKTSDDNYKLTSMPDQDRPSVEYIVELDDEPYRVRILSVDFSGFETVTFDGYGMPNSGGTVLIGVGGEKRLITVDPDTGEAYLP